MSETNRLVIKCHTIKDMNHVKKQNRSQHKMAVLLPETYATLVPKFTNICGNERKMFVGGAGVHTQEWREPEDRDL